MLLSVILASLREETLDPGGREIRGKRSHLYRDVRYYYTVKLNRNNHLNVT